MKKRFMAAKSWDRAAWLVSVNGGEPKEMITENGLTWALRALITAGDQGVFPHDTTGGRWALLVDQLRAAGLPVEDLPTDDEGRRGYRLAATVQRAVTK